MTEEIVLSLFVLSLFFQVALFIFVFPNLLFHKPVTHTTTPGVSVIVAAHNEEENLKILIPLLLAQKYPNFEIIVANDRSSDNSSAYLKSVSGERLKHIDISDIPNGINPKKNAITLAIKEATNDIILLTDADCYPVSELWISKMVQNIGSKDIVLGFSPYEKRAGYLNLLIRFETLITAIQYLSFSHLGFTYMGVGRNLGYRKSLFVQKDGFRGYENISGGDDDLFIGKISTNSNTVICIEKEALMISVPKSDWRGFFFQKLRHLSVGKQYKWKQKIPASLYPLSQLLFYITGIYLLIYSPQIYSILGAFILRTFILIVIFALITRKLGNRLKWYWIPIADLCYMVYYLTVGITAFFYKRVQWK